MQLNLHQSSMMKGGQSRKGSKKVSMGDMLFLVKQTPPCLNLFWIKMSLLPKINQSYTPHHLACQIDMDDYKHNIPAHVSNQSVDSSVLMKLIYDQNH